MQEHADSAFKNGRRYHAYHERSYVLVFNQILAKSTSYLTCGSPMMMRSKIEWTSSIIFTVSFLGEIFTFHPSAQILGEYWI